MSRLPSINGVCIKATPDVESYLQGLDECRYYFVQHKISATATTLTPGKPYKVKILINNGQYLVLTCVGHRTPKPEIILLDGEVINTRRTKKSGGLLAWTAATALTTLDLIHISLNNTSMIINVVNKILDMIRM